MRVRTFVRFTAVALTGLAGLTVVSTSASAGDRLSRSAASQAAKVRATAASNGKGETTVLCFRRSRSNFKCGALTVLDDGKGRVTFCSRTYGVRSSGGRIRVKLLNHHCEVSTFLGPQTGDGPKYCPGNKRTWNAKPDIEGKTYGEAVPIAKAHKCSIRIVEIDGVGQIITEDFSYQRLDVAVEGPDQVITEVVGVF